MIRQASLVRILFLSHRKMSKTAYIATSKRARQSWNDPYFWSPEPAYLSLLKKVPTRYSSDNWYAIP